MRTRSESAACSIESRIFSCGRRSLIPLAAGLLSLLLAPACGGGRFDARPAPAAEPPPVQPPPEAPLDDGVSKPPFDGLDTAVAGDGRVVLVWQPVLDSKGKPDVRFSYQVFAGDAFESVDFETPILETDPGAGWAEIESLPDSDVEFFAARAHLLVEPQPGEVEDQNVMVLGAVPRSVLYVDATAPPGGDGKTPATAFSTLTEALIAAIRQGGANIWAASGDYDERVFLPEDVSLYGGFPPSFDPRERTAQSAPTRLVTSTAGGTLLSVASGRTWRVADGLDLVGGGAASVGVLVDKARAILVGLHITDTVTDGIDTRGGTAKKVRAILHRCLVERAGNEGLDHTGPVRLFIQRTQVTGSHNEGLQANDLSVLPGGFSEIVIRSSVFTSNGNEGVQIDLDEIDPLVGGTSKGGFEQVLIEDCFMAGNLQAGMLVDVDFDASDEIGASIRLRTSRVRGNGTAGIRIDADQPVTVQIDGCRSTANYGPGIRLEGDSPVPLLQVANCLSMANAGRGVELLAQSTMLVSFSLVMDNQAEGIAGPAGTIMVESSVIHRNAGGDLARGQVRYSFIGDQDGGTGNVTGKPRLAHTARRVVFLDSAGQVDRFTAPDSAMFDIGDLIETADDGVERLVSAIEGKVVIFAPPADRSLVALDAILLFSGASVVEDFRPRADSPLVDAGWPMEQDRDSSPADIGLFGGPLGDAPGFTRRPLVTVEPPFQVVRLDLPPGTGKPPAAIRFGLSHPADSTSLSPAALIVRQGGVDVPGKRRVDGLDVVFVPDKPFAAGAYSVGVGPGLRADDGSRILVAFDYGVRFR